MLPDSVGLNSGLDTICGTMGVASNTVGGAPGCAASGTMRRIGTITVGMDVVTALDGAWPTKR